MNIEDHISWAEVVASNFRNEKSIPIEHKEAISLGMVGLMKAARNYREDEGKFRSFAWVKIRGEIKDWVQSSMRHKNLAPMICLEDLSLDQLPSVNGTEKKVINRELVEKLLTLPTARQAQVIKVYYLEEHLMKDIAKNFNVTQSNISILIRNGIRKMRKAIRLGYV